MRPAFLTCTGDWRSFAPRSWGARARGIAGAMPGLIYRVYESRLLRQVERLPKPRHVGIILDGNRRFGRQHQVNDPRALYLLGAHKLDAILEWCGELRI